MTTNPQFNHADFPLPLPEERLVSLVELFMPMVQNIVNHYDGLGDIGDLQRIGRIRVETAAMHYAAGHIQPAAFPGYVSTSITSGMIDFQRSVKRKKEEPLDLKSMNRQKTASTEDVYLEAERRDLLRREFDRFASSGKLTQREQELLALMRSDQNGTSLCAVYNIAEGTLYGMRARLYNKAREFMKERNHD